MSTNPTDVQQPPAGPAEPLRYEPPIHGYLIDWSGSQTERYKPTPRQQVVIDAVVAALQAGRRTHHDVVNFCRARFGFHELNIARDSDALGMDCYQARGYLDARRYFALERQAWSRLHLSPGQALGTLVFNDCKRTNSVTVARVELETRHFHLVGRRGRLQVEVRVNALQLAHAIDRAKERRLRGTSFDEFTASTATPAAAVVSENRSESPAYTTASRI